MDLILTIVWIYLFTKKLFQLFIDIEINKQHNVPLIHQKIRSYSAHSIQLNLEQISVISVATRCTILSIMALFSTQIFYIYYSVLFVIYVYTKNKILYEEMWKVYLLLWWFAILVNAITIFLNLDSTFSMYSLCCVRAHECCEICCERLAKKQVKRNRLKNKPIDYVPLQI
eukprot:333363_1